MNTHGYRVWCGITIRVGRVNYTRSVICMILDLNRKLTGVTDLQFYSCGVDIISPSTLTLLLLVK